MTAPNRSSDPGDAIAPQRREGNAGKIFWIRFLVALTLLAGVNYVAWRWFASLNWDAWWIAVPLVAAETYSLIDVLLFGHDRLAAQVPHAAGTGSRGRHR